MALTDIQIKRAKPQDKPYTLNDGQGLSLLVNPDGSRGWRFRFRFAGKARLMSFGSYDIVSLAEAHEKRDTARKQVANGIDPVEERKAQKLAQQLSTENSFEAICREWHTNKADRWTVAYREEIIKTFEQDVFPFIGKRPISEIIPANERAPQLKEKIQGELAVIVHQLMQRSSDPQDARRLLQSQQNSGEAMRIKRDADPMVDFCVYLFATAEPTGLHMGNASIRPLQPKRYLYHAYLAYMEANGYRNPLSMKSFSQALESILREYGLNYLKRRTKSGIQTKLDLMDESSDDWLPKCDGPGAARLTELAKAGFFTPILHHQ